jgi:hypothetical protein
MWFHFIRVVCAGERSDERRRGGNRYQQSGGNQLSGNLLGRFLERLPNHVYGYDGERFDLRWLVGSVLGNGDDLQRYSDDEYDRYSTFQRDWTVGDHPHRFPCAGEPIDG